MSNAVLKGNASGSGTVTLETPNTNTDRTISLPDATCNIAYEDSSGNLQVNSGYGSKATAYGCRAWVNFNGTGTVAIRASGNVSSITDNGTGQYTVNFTTALPDANYCVSALAGYNNYITAVVRLDDVPAQTTTALKLECAELGSATADTFQFNVAIFR